MQVAQHTDGTDCQAATRGRDCPRHHDYRPKLWDSYRVGQLKARAAWLGTERDAVMLDADAGPANCTQAATELLGGPVELITIKGNVAIYARPGVL